ncbi:hypothetical protein MHTCC0001_07900 [Flavobacteriaceae bacterium MHTCC 0001]
MKKIVLFALVNLALFQDGISQASPDLYLGLTPPGETPEVFAPGVVSLSTRNERVITFSPSGHEIFFVTGDWPNRKTMYIAYKNNTWSSPVTASFSVNRSAEEPFFSPDGNRVYYYAFLPSSTTNSDLYYSEKNNSTWSDPIPLSSVNSNQDEYHPNVVNDGSIYFTDEKGKAFRAQYNNGNFENRVALPNNVNLGGNWVWLDHYVSPDESFMIFSANQSGGNGGNDLYISFKNSDDSWTTPQNFGNTINTSGNELSPDITADGKYMTYDRNGDIYWVRIDSIIETLKASSGVLLSTNTSPYDSFKIKLLPNPTSDTLSIVLEDIQYKTILVEVFNVNGQALISKKFDNISKSIIDLTNQPKGVYLLKLQVGKDTITRKIVKE